MSDNNQPEDIPFQQGRDTVDRQSGRPYSQPALNTTASGTRVTTTASVPSLLPILGSQEQLQKAISADVERRLRAGLLPWGISSSGAPRSSSQARSASWLTGQPSEQGLMPPPPHRSRPGELSPDEILGYDRAQELDVGGSSSQQYYPSQPQQLHSGGEREGYYSNLLQSDDYEDQVYEKFVRGGPSSSDKGKRPASGALSLNENTRKQLRIAGTSGEVEDEDDKVQEIDPATGLPVISQAAPTSTRPTYRTPTVRVTVETDWGTSLGPQSENRTTYAYELKSGRSREFLKDILSSLKNIKLQDEDALVQDARQWESRQRKGKGNE
ncbi:hypothetical protein IAR50_004936 [Cryptococcus sp. DSM 104548]